MIPRVWFNPNRLRNSGWLPTKNIKHSSKLKSLEDFLKKIDSNVLSTFSYAS